MTILQHSIAQAAAAATGYQIARSLRFNSADNAYLNRTPGSAGNRQKWTYSTWIKRCAFGTRQSFFVGGSTSGAGTNLVLVCQFTTANELEVFGATWGNAVDWDLVTTQVFRDPSAWYHIVIAVDTTQATASNRVKLYVNGTQITVFGTSTYPTQNYNTAVNNTVVQVIGASTASLYNVDQYQTETYLIDGQQLDPTSFGQTDSATGVWMPKQVTGMTYGTNGFYLNFSDNSNTTAATLGKDSSGNSNNWTPNNFSVTAGVGNDSLVDSPTNYGTDTGAGGEVRGNYATLNPLGVNGAAGTFSNGNLDYLTQNTDSRAGVATIPCNTGGSDKWYCEITIGSKTNTYYTVGVFSSTVNAYSNNPVALYRGDGLIALNGTSQGTFTSYTQNDVIGMSYNNSNGELKFYKNNTLITTLTLTSSTLFFFGASSDSSGNTANYSFNFGQRPFAYTAPSGFKALCTQNLPTPAIGASASTLASQQFNTVLYTGNGVNGRSITGVGFQPDLTWIKRRDASAFDHVLKAVGQTKFLSSSTTDADRGNAGDLVTSLDADGFTVNTTFSGGTTNATTNGNAATYVAWNWKAGGAAVSNTAGSITSQVSANAAAGISVVTYTGTGANATVGHGLGAVPKMIIAKNRDSALNWIVYHANIGAANTLILNTTAASAADNAWQGVTPTSTVFSLGVTGSGNESTKKHVAYCFAEVTGFSKFGSYVGNNSVDGPFVYCGFRPRFVMIKNSSNLANWTIVDTSRNTYNVADARLFPSTSGQESTSVPNVDILSNGFRVKVTGTSDTGANTNNETYVFAAFAESPFNYSRAR